MPARKKRLDKLHSTSSYTRNLIEASLDLFVTINAEGKITDVNKATEDVTGCTRGQLIGSDFSDYFTEPDKARVGYKKVFSEGYVRDFPLALRHKSGKVTDVLYNAIVSRNEAGEIQGIFAAARDVTEHNRMEEELKLRSELLDIASDSILLRDFEGNVLYANEAMYKTRGYTKDEFLKMNINNIITPGQALVLGQNAEEILKNGDVVFETNQIRKDGSKMLVEVHARLTEVRGRKLILSVTRDITRRKIMEEKLRDSERLATIGQTAGMVAHDIRNPLQSISGALYLMKSDIESMYESAVKKDLDGLLKSVEEDVTYINKIVGDLQDFTHQIKPDMRDVDIRSLLKEILKTISIPDNVKAAVKVSRIFNIHVDPDLMKRVFTNLVINAIQAMAKGGSLTIKAKKNEHDIVVSIVDTGVGIPEDVKPKLFTPLFTTKSKGQGFGLAVCKRIVEAHNGSISFESEIGKGTTFTVKIPNKD
ncbi:MAG: domain S-box protein [Thermoproteota archaeon]|nr:domain S-box protein [Thermoproteota archaeon]